MKGKMKIAAAIAALTLLSVLLALSTFAFFSATFEIYDSVSESVIITLNGNQPVFLESDFDLNPGETITKTLTVTNDGPVPIYYSIFFDRVSGTARDYLRFDFYCEDKCVKTVKAAYFTSGNALVSDNPLAAGETREYTVQVTLEHELDGDRENTLDFDIVTKAIEARPKTISIFN